MPRSVVEGRASGRASASPSRLQHSPIRASLGRETDSSSISLAGRKDFGGSTNGARPNLGLRGVRGCRAGRKLGGASALDVVPLASQLRRRQSRKVSRRLQASDQDAYARFLSSCPLPDVDLSRCVVVVLSVPFDCKRPRIQRVKHEGPLQLSELSTSAVQTDVAPTHVTAFRTHGQANAGDWSGAAGPVAMAVHRMKCRRRAER